MDGATLTAIMGGVVALVVIVGATVAVALHAISGDAFTAIIAGIAGVGGGAGAHAAGTSRGAQ